MSRTPSRILLKHVGNLGDHLFLVGALLEGVARVWPHATVTLVTAWGYKDRQGRWGKRNQDGYGIALMKENPHVDHLVHWSDALCSPEGRICVEEGKRFPTWNRAYFEHVKPTYDIVAELEFGLQIEENPLERIAAAAGLPYVSIGPYPFYGSPQDGDVGRQVADRFPRPRVVFLEGLNSTTMRGWDPRKVTALAQRFRDVGVTPLWWGASFTPLFRGRKLTLRENIALLGQCDLAIGVLGAPMHFAAAAGVQTLCLYGAQFYARAAPGFFFNQTIPDSRRHHSTVFGPTCDEPCALKRVLPCKNLTGEARITTGFRSWQAPGRQHDKSCIATIAAETVFATAAEALERRGLWPK
ncbi:MAG: hypothetical protein G01um101438_584 [Parcubacteria group bacterium Gr01-1014_38]|nr:MAG: hypothetical protein G01um101438_584 [Parcubacteria group bacterium Gr01-1014_38]